MAAVFGHGPPHRVLDVDDRGPAKTKAAGFWIRREETMGGGRRWTDFRRVKRSPKWRYEYEVPCARIVRDAELLVVSCQVS